MLSGNLFEAVIVTFEAAGVIAMIAGFIIAVILSIRILIHGGRGRAAYLLLRSTIGSSILLGLEVLVAADLIRTISSTPSFEEAAVLGIIVLIRTVLSMSLQIEIDGVLPWRRALLPDGGQMLARSVAHGVRGTSRTMKPQSGSGPSDE